MKDFLLLYSRNMRNRYRVCAYLRGERRRSKKPREVFERLFYFYGKTRKE